MIEFDNILEKLAKESYQDPFPRTDCLVEIGHSIELGSDGNWYPTRLAQSVREDGVWSDGARKYARLGRRMTSSIKGLYDSDHTIVGGGVLETAACAILYSQLEFERKAPQLLIHTGGRAGYLDIVASKQPDITEAGVMQPLFRRFLSSYSTIDPDKALPSFELVLTSAKTTKEDMQCSMYEAANRACETMTILALEMRLPRCWLFVQDIIASNPLVGEIEVKFRSAESLIGISAETMGRSRQWNDVLAEFKSSKPYARTMSDERNGFNMAAKGTYSGTGKT